VHHQIQIENNVPIPVKPNSRKIWHAQVQKALATMSVSQSFTVTSRYLSTEAQIAARLIGKKLFAMRLDDQKSFRLWYMGDYIRGKRPTPAAKAVQVECNPAAPETRTVTVQGHSQDGKEEWRDDNLASLRRLYDNGEISDSDYQKRILRVRLKATNSPRRLEIDSELAS
jgi:hypothetical protein